MGRLVLILSALVIGAWAKGDPLPWEKEKLHGENVEQRHDGFWVAEQMQLTIANPMHGTFFCEMDDPVPIHVLFNRDVIPEGGHGLITIEDRVREPTQFMQIIRSLHFHSGPANQPPTHTRVGLFRPSPSC